MIPSGEALAGFELIGRGDVGFAGGKGANLGELAGAGFPVPDGFVVGAPAYAAFCDRGGLRQRIEERLDGLDIEDTKALNRAAEEIRSWIEAEPVPGWLQLAIADAYLGLGEGDVEVPVAVRSSATAEDTEAASFAGMNETLLNQRGVQAVREAVRRCWSSLFGARTIYYRAERGLGQAGMDIAVVVQRQIDASRAGVMFTIDPASGASDRIVIEGSLGLGEAVVSGSVTPDRYVVGKRPLAILSREVRQKELAVTARATGGTQSLPLSGREREIAVLDDEEALRIAELGLRVEAHYGSPQDTEWAIDAAGEVWLLQSRPVTSAGGAASPHGQASGRELLSGLGAAPGIASGAVRLIGSREEAAKLSEGEVLVTHMTAPDWVPLMRRAA
ncbi:MAG TPA: PEP/pyruvate-binding domain-containing protein, partial [Solirubrobacterales bacterium]|nr:PEP/pyruvate-binding domain-containing protein [Solirubrobacterales bacterium]